MVRMNLTKGRAHSRSTWRGKRITLAYGSGFQGEGCHKIGVVYNLIQPIIKQEHSGDHGEAERRSKKDATATCI